MGLFRWLWERVFGGTKLRDERKELGLAQHSIKLAKASISLKKQEKKIAGELISVLQAHYAVISQEGKIKEGRLDSLFQEVLSDLEKIQKEALSVHEEQLLLNRVRQLIDKYGRTANAMFYAFAKNPQYRSLYSTTDIDGLNALNNRLQQLVQALRSELALEESIDEQKKNILRSEYELVQTEEGK